MQYQIPADLEFKTLRFCIDRYTAHWIYVREKGKGAENTVFVNESLEHKVLDFEVGSDGVLFFVNSNEIFHFPLKRISRHLLFEYERTEIVEIDGYKIERRINPHLEEELPSELLPKPSSTLAKAVWDGCYIEIAFNGEIKLEFHSWWNKELGWKYWKPAGLEIS